MMGFPIMEGMSMYVSFISSISDCDPSVPQDERYSDFLDEVRIK
jgi:hypothetical protein